MATTWSNPHTNGALATCTTGSESAPTQATDGLDVRDLDSFVVHAEAAAAMTGGGKLVCYLYNKYGASGAGRWNPCPDLDLVVSAVQYQAFPGAFVALAAERVAYVPSGVGQAVNVFMLGSHK